MKTRILATTALVLLLTGCNSSSATSSSVPWNDYSSSVKTTIDAATAAKDCAGLQAQFDNADANNEATKARTGHNNADLMAYIEDARKSIGCS